MKPNLRGITLLEQVGNGAGSIVFRAKDNRTDQDLAVKSVTPEIVVEIQQRDPSPEYGDNIRKSSRFTSHRSAMNGGSDTG